MIKPAEKDIPVLDAYRTIAGDQLTAFCPHCEMWHYHGIPAGHRIAHCHDGDSPYHQTGYILSERGPITADIVRRFKIRRGRGNSKPSVLRAKSASTTL